MPDLTEPLRYPALKGGINFRDFGGYDTVDGGRVTWGKLYRSGHLAGLTNDCRATLDRLGIAAVCDFRTDHENKSEPSNLPVHMRDGVLRLDIWPKAARSVGHMVKGMADGRYSDADIQQGQNAVYREFVTDFSDRYAAMFRHILAAGGRPVLIHCMVGKDRTGLGAALIQAALGVPEDSIHADYELTNRSETNIAYIRGIAERGAQVGGTDDPKAIEDLFQRFMATFGARRDSLQAAFDAIRDMSGTIDAYFNDVLQIGPRERAQLREWFVKDKV